ncbi:MAG: type IV pilus assembly protein PilN [Pseudohongiellaceae bacterium]|jgi:type IV pilus assembly protein PilN
MAQINLLPWRERLREEQRREFLNILVGIVIIAGGLVLLVDRYFNGEIDAQVARNNFIKTEIAILDERVREITQLRQQKEDIRARMNVITDLQGTRPVIVRIFDELVNTLPAGVYYQTVERTGERIALEGIAESYSGITELLRNLGGSTWFRDPDLSAISEAAGAANSLTNALSFTLTVTLESLTQQDEV